MPDPLPDDRRYGQAKQILQGALDIPPDQREAYLDAACQNDLHLRAEVDSLLAAHDVAASGFLASPLAANTEEAEPDAIDVEPDLSGRRVGAYRLERLLGRGGMGAVYLASRDDGEFTKHVAIKFVRPSMVAPAGLKRFRVERQLLSDIDHPRIARLLDGGTAEGGLPFFIMEYVPGETLAQVLVRGPLPESRAVQLAMGVADVLETVHSRGLVFRDLKPSNIMLSEQSGVKVLDFGIAKIMAGTDEDDSTTMSMTGPGKIIGSPRYMSPEQASGERVDARSDIFSFGVVMYEALTGRLPFDGETRKDYLFNLMVGKPVPLPPTVPAGLRVVIEKCLRSSPGKRYASGQTLLEALREVTGTITVIERPAPARALWATVALVALVAVAFTVWTFRRPQTVEPALLKGPAGLVATWASNETSPRVSPDLKWVSFISNRGESTRLWLVNRATGAERVLVPPGQGPVMLSQEWSPASDEIASVARLGIRTSLTITPLGEARPRVFELPQTDIELVRWIGDGLYYLVAGSLWRFDLRTASPREITTARGELRLRSVDVSADERHIVFAAVDNQISSIWYAAIDGSNAVRLTEERMDPRYLRWKGAPARDVVFLSNEGGMVDIWQLDVSTRQRQHLTLTDAREGSLDVSADGALLVYEQIREEAHLATLDPGRKSPSLNPLTSDSLSDLMPDASGSGREVVFQRSKNLDMALGVSSASIQLSRDFLQGPPVRLADGIAPEISRDGQWVAYSIRKGPGTVAELWVTDVLEQRAMLVSASLLRVPYAPFPLALTARNIAWSPEGPTLYFLAQRPGGGADIWSAVPAHGRPVTVNQVTHLEDDRAVLSDVQVAVDGSRISYLLRSQARGGSELHVVDITRMDDGVSFTEKAGFLLNCPGWTSAGEMVVLRTDPGHSLTDILLVKAGRTTEIGQLRDVTRSTATLDPLRRVLYFVRAEGQAYGLHAVSLDTGRERPVFMGGPHGPAYSGIRVLGDGRLLFSLQSQNHDILSGEFGK